MVRLSGTADLPAWREAKHAAMLGAPVVTGSGALDTAESFHSFA